eukprot:403330916
MQSHNLKERPQSHSSTKYQSSQQTRNHSNSFICQKNKLNSDLNLAKYDKVDKNGQNTYKSSKQNGSNSNSFIVNNYSSITDSLSKQVNSMINHAKNNIFNTHSNQSENKQQQNQRQRSESINKQGCHGNWFKQQQLQQQYVDIMPNNAFQKYDNQTKPSTTHAYDQYGSKDIITYEDDHEKTDSYFQTPKSFNLDQDNTLLNSDIKLQTPQKQTDPYQINNPRDDHNKISKVEAKGKKVYEMINQSTMLNDSENLEETSMIPMRQIIHQAQQVKKNDSHKEYFSNREDINSIQNYNSQHNQATYFTLGQQEKQQKEPLSQIQNQIPQTDIKTKKQKLSCYHPQKDPKLLEQTSDMLIESQIINNQALYEDRVINSIEHQFNQKTKIINQQYESLNQDRDFDESVVIDDAEEFRSLSVIDKFNKKQSVARAFDIQDYTSLNKQDDQSQSMIVELQPIQMSEHQQSFDQIDQSQSQILNNLLLGSDDQQQDQASAESFIIKEQDITDINHSYQLALGMRLLQHNYNSNQDNTNSQSQSYQEYSQNFPADTDKNHLNAFIPAIEKILENENEKNAQNMNFSVVYDRLYMHAKDLRFKQEFEKYVDEYMVRKGLGQRMPYQSLSGEKSKQKKSSKQSISRQNINDGAYSDFNSVQKNRQSGRSTSNSAYSNQLHEEHLVRQIKNSKVVEELERKIKDDMNIQKSNKNSHNLALKKLEKDLFQILKHMSKKVFQNTDSNEELIQNLTPQQLEENLRKQYHDGKQSQNELFLSKRQIQEFFVATNIFKYINEDIPENLSNKELEKMNQEIEFLDHVWAIVNLKFDAMNQQQTFQVELEFVLQFFKIIFDPYSSIDQQASLIVELRKIIKNILNQNNFQINDILDQLIQSRDEQVLFYKRLITDFRQMNSNFYNISHLTNLQYRSNRVSLSPSRKSRAVDDKKFARFQDNQQCVFQPKINSKSRRMDPFSKQQFLQSIIESQGIQRCNSEVVDEDDCITPSSRFDSRKIINALDASHTNSSRQNNSFIQQNNFSNFSNQQQSQQLFDDNQDNFTTNQDQDYKEKLVQVFSIQNYNHARTSPSRQQLLALGFQGSTDDSKQTYYDEIVQIPSSKKSNHIQNIDQQNLTRNSQVLDRGIYHNNSVNYGNSRSSSHINRNIILFEQGKRHSDYQKQHSEKMKKQEESKFSFHPDINKKSKRMMTVYNDDESSSVTPSAHDRLHLLKVRKEIQKEDLKENYKRELSEKRKKECPFQPQISSSIKYDPQRVQRVQPKGFDQIVKRMKDGQVLKAKKLSDFINLGQVKNYSGKPTVSEPFEFETNKREQDRRQKLRKPFIIIEIIISPGRVAHLPIYHGDDPILLCQNFSRTYNLGRQARESLLQILQSHLIGESVGDTSYSTARNDIEREYGIMDSRNSSPKKNITLRLQNNELEFSKIVEVSETNESDGLAKLLDKENLIR